MNINKKNQLILCLLVIAVLLFCVIQFFLLPASREKKAQYAQDQTDALTHDISAILDYRNPYIGNASNIGNLFRALPLNDVSMNFEIDPERCALKVNYLDSVQNIGEEKIHRDLIYNSAAAMAAIDNLSQITYCFSDKSYSFDRIQLEAVFGSPLSQLLEGDNWMKTVQTPLKSAEFIGLQFTP